MTRHPSLWLMLATVGLGTVSGCRDLRLIDPVELGVGGSAGGTGLSGSAGDTGLSEGGNAGANFVTRGGMTSTAGGTTSGIRTATVGGNSSPGGAENGVSTGGVSTGGVSTGGVSTGGVSTGGVSTGGVSTGGVSTGGVSTGGVSTGGVSTGGVSTGGVSTGGVSTGGVSTGGVSTGGVSTGGVSTGGVSTGGVSTGGVSTGGVSTGGVSTGGVSTGGSDQGAAGAAGRGYACPNPITKPAALVAAEPTPADPCARVSNVIFHRAGYYAFGFTNGEIHISNGAAPASVQRVDVWKQSGVDYSLPRALVTAMYAPTNNNEGALEVGYADPKDELLKPWYAGMAGWSWTEATVEQTGTVLGISACPFHGAPTHLELLTPWWIQETKGTTYSFASVGSPTLNQHLQLAGGGSVTAIELATTAGGWLVFAGTEAGELYVSNLLSGSVTWNDATGKLNVPVSWTRLTDSNMPSSWVTRIAVHPLHAERLLATFGSRGADTVWYSDDQGATWSNRHSDLPTASNPPMAPPVIGASFNPWVDGAAYVVTPQTSYYTTDDGITWHEW